MFGIVHSETDNQLNEEQGQDEYRNVQVIHSIDTPNLHMCERLRELQPSSGEDTKVKRRVLQLDERSNS